MVVCAGAAGDSCRGSSGSGRAAGSGRQLQEHRQVPMGESFEALQPSSSAAVLRTGCPATATLQLQLPQVPTELALEAGTQPIPDPEKVGFESG